MKYTGTTYRPPYEANSLLIQVTQGCSHNNCSFCTMYRDVPFMMESIEQIKSDLLEARQMYRSVRRIFLLNGDAFTLGFDKLKEIGEMIIDIFPEVEDIASYATIQSIARKTDDELKALRDLRFNGMNVGFESGNDKVLSLFTKGNTAAESEEQLMRLKTFGYDFCMNVIMGGGGLEYSKEHIDDTAAIINRINPWMVFLMTLFVTPGSPLHDMVQRGELTEGTAGDVLMEEERLINSLHLDNTYILGMHTSNAVPIAGILPQDKNKMLSDLRTGIANLDENFLNKTHKRSTEGRYVD
ncbi:radical SAM protein [Veillonella agrestimuris]|uniref:radical SAM protein n=1 Tax=Veillonella agrestimuris TaxID=2941340 RepID=UPI0020408ECA|nr:radical SAM protein [Veillonella agrestimuris]